MAQPIPLRLEMGLETKFQRARSFEHSDICRAFNLDPATYHFHLPRSAYGKPGTYERVSGFVFQGDNPTPVGTIHVALPGERFLDRDPDNERDRLDLRKTDRN